MLVNRTDIPHSPRASGIASASARSKDIHVGHHHHHHDDDDDDDGKPSISIINSAGSTRTQVHVSLSLSVCLSVFVSLSLSVCLCVCPLLAYLILSCSLLLDPCLTPTSISLSIYLSIPTYRHHCMLHDQIDPCAVSVLCVLCLFVYSFVCSFV